MINDSEHYLSYAVVNGTSGFFQQETLRPIESENDFNFEKAIYWVNFIITMHVVSFYVFTQAIFFVLILTIGQLGTEFRMDLAKTKAFGGIENVRCRIKEIFIHCFSDY